MRKELFVTLGLLACIVVGSILYFRYMPQSGPAPSLFSALPSETFIAVLPKAEKHLVEIIDQNPFLSHLLADTLFYLIAEEYRAGSEYLSQMGYQGEAVWALARLGSQRVGLIAVTQEMTGDVAHSSPETGADGFILKAANGLCLLSQHSLLIEGAERALAEPGLSPFKEFEMGNSDLSVWINFEALPWVMPLLSGQRGTDWHDQLASWKGYGSYSAQVQNDGVNLFGQLATSDATSFFSHANYSKPAPLGAIGLLSDKVSFFEAHAGFSIENQLRARMLDTIMAAAVDSLGQVLGLDLLGQLAPSLGTELLYCAANTFNHHIENELIMFASVVDQTNLVRLLAALDTSSWQSSVDSFVVGRLPSGDFLPYLFGNGASSLSTPYWAVHQGYLLLANSENTLRKWWADMKAGSLFVNSPEYGLTAEWITQPANYLFYVQPAKSFGIPGDLLEGPALEFYKRIASPIKNTAFFSFRLVKQEQGFFNHIYFHTQGGGYAAPLTQVISRDFEASLLEGPFLVSNHHTGSKELLVADNLNVHVINQSNELVWTYKLGDKLLGPPIELDVYRNKKIQYLLSTRRHLHLVDRTGSSVSAYPLALPKPLAAEVSMIDLKENGGEQLFVPCGKSSIYAYTSKGVPLVGWNPMALQARAKTPMQYFVKNGNTYLFASDVKGGVYVWLPNGKKAVEPIACGLPFVSGFTIQFGAQLADCKLLGLDSAGNFNTIGLNGVVKKTPIGPAFHAPQGAWIQFDGEGGKELMVWQGTMLAVYSQALAILLKLSIDEPIASAQWLTSSSGRVFLALHTTANGLMLFNAKGQQVGATTMLSASHRTALYDWDVTEGDELVSLHGKQVLIYKNVENGSD